MKKTLLIAMGMVLVVAGTVPMALAQEIAVCYVPGSHSSIQSAVDDHTCATIVVGPGNWAGATVHRSVEIRGEGKAVIDDGPNSHSFLRAGFLFPGGGAGSGTTIRGLEFQGTPQFGYTDDGHLDFPIFSRGAYNVAVRGNVFTNSLQAITNWSGSGWSIEHNTIEGLWTLNGGGIGILMGERSGGSINNNTVAHNKVTGTLNVWSGDGGGYCGTGIVLYADFRWGAPGASAISSNSVVKNTVSLVSDTPAVVDVVAIELTDTRDDSAGNPVIFGNAVGFNDLRGTQTGIVLTPANLDEVNDISRNLGDNRGQGLHPSLFGPGG
ncbi:MAG: hypothetical protein GTO63_03525 [Anaerolineae bacterium]|nr:hypothetical protein [Anaerolineae bacterium]NIN94078.1 hypothetical protein [Anaerolineae bacterium]NIQ77124.1 hypothetical protein [Anaerolineae bacterium]